MTAAVPLILGAFAIYGAVIAAIWLFITSQRADMAESDAERAYRFREQMRRKSHDRRYQ